jgi:hypothetical protein
MAIFPRVHMPPLVGANGWLKSEPLAPAELRGRGVLVDFWTFTCINWLRTEPVLAKSIERHALVQSEPWEPR